MRIAVNAMPSSGYGGITYLRNILPVLEQSEDDHVWFVYAQTETLAKIAFPAHKIVFREIPSSGIVGRLIAEQFRLPALMRRDRIDLVYTANNPDLFLAPRPRVIAIRYTEPFVYRSFYNSFSKRVRCAALYALTKLSLRTSDHVVCVSEYARRIAGADRPALAGKTSIVHHGLGRPFRPGGRRPDWAPEEYLFTSAKMIGYSNLIALVEAYAVCRSAGLDDPLFIAGGPHDRNYESELKQRVRELGLEQYVTFLGYISAESMAAGMANAKVFVFGSLLEACPNTLLEALGCGAATVASDTAPNREVAGEAVAWCDGRNPASIAAAILRTARNETYRRLLKARALVQSSQYSWRKTADNLIAVLERVRQTADSTVWAGSEPPTVELSKAGPST
ncbi:MAG: glycosyltransferase family 4 protein [Bryobacteraceae bacterium]|nr:glycosyltransferase family 4 protein [Bryobacteraceae bacterium]